MNEGLNVKKCFYALSCCMRNFLVAALEVANSLRNHCMTLENEIKSTKVSYIWLCTIPISRFVNWWDFMNIFVQENQHTICCKTACILCTKGDTEITCPQNSHISTVWLNETRNELTRKILMFKIDLKWRIKLLHFFTRTLKSHLSCTIRSFKRHHRASRKLTCGIQVKKINLTCNVCNGCGFNAENTNAFIMKLRQLVILKTKEQDFN